MKTKIQAAALILVMAFSAAFAVLPVQAAATLTDSNSFGLRFVYHHDGKTPSAADAMPVNVVIVRDGKTYATVSNLKYGERFSKTLPNGIYKIDIYIYKTGKLFDSIKLSNRTNQKDNGLSVVMRLPGTNPPPYPRVIYWVNGVKVK